MIMTKRLRHSLLWVSAGAALILGPCCPKSVAQMMTAASSSDGAGTFTYTFSHTNYPYVWKMSNDSGFFMQFFDVTNSALPEGWGTTNLSGNYRAWIFTNGTFYLDNTSVSFVVQTRWKKSTNYSNNFNWPSSKYYMRGMLLAYAVNSTNHGPVGAPGYQYYDYVGPSVPHFASEEQSGDELRFTICDNYGTNAVIETSSNLLAGSWSPVTTVTWSAGCTTIVVRATNSGPASVWRFRGE
jgi:hypothetical protein